MATVNPTLAYVSTFVAGAGVAQSGFATFTFFNLSNFEAFVPVEMTVPGTTSISAGAEVTTYRSGDGGTKWETDGSLQAVFTKPTTAGQVQRRGIRLRPGRYLVAVQVGGGVASTWSAALGTAEVITALA